MSKGDYGQPSAVESILFTNISNCDALITHWREEREEIIFDCIKFNG